MTILSLGINVVKERKTSRGFTLIELLIVIAVLGVLAAVVLVAIDPAQQLARGRDSGRKTSIGQLGRAMQAYYTSRQQYPQGNAGGDWNIDPHVFVQTGEIKKFPANPLYSGTFIGVPCGYAAGVAYGGVGTSPICYKISGGEVVTYLRMESKSENSRCPSATPNAWFVWSSADGRAGVVCRAGALPPGDPLEPNPGFQTFL